jgi:hypothetical protein
MSVGSKIKVKFAKIYSIKIIYMFRLSLDVVSRGDTNKINYDFFNFILLNIKNIEYIQVYNDLLDSNNINIDFIIQQEYYNLIFICNPSLIGYDFIDGVFVDVERNKNIFNILFFFDINTMYLKKSLIQLRNWMLNFAEFYCFDYFICKMDNGDETDYYFDINGFGNLFHVI